MKVLYISTADCKYGAAKTQMDMILELKNTYQVEPVVLTKKHNKFNELCDNLKIENYSYWYRDIMAGSAYSNPVLNILKHIIKYSLFLLGGITQHGIEKCGIDMNTIDIIHSNHIRIDIGVYLCKKYQKPHIWHIKELNKGHVKILHYKKKCYDYINNNADVFIAVTNQVKEFWCKAGLEEKKVQVIYEGINYDKFLLKKERNDEKLKLVCVGRIEKSKGQLQILQAIKKLPNSIKKNVTLDLIGNPYPDYFRQLQAFIKANNMEKIVNFLGYCDDIPKKLSNYDVGILASRGDAFGTVTAEYMAAGLLVIATYTELVENMKTGLRYEFGDINKLCENITFAHKNKEEVRLLSEAGKKRIRAEFSISNNARQIYEIYEKLN